MPVLDFREIPSAAAGAGRDQFELFAREFLGFVGLRPVVHPDRGADAGRDLIVEEIRTGVAGETRVRWLVSCKHKAHSGAAVGAEDERDIHDRVRTHECRGFLGFYSTVPSSGLAAKLNAPHPDFEALIYDPERIERELLSANGWALAKRFFPESSAKWQAEHPSPVKIFRESPTLVCLYCGKDLFRPEPHGIVVIWSSKKDEVEHVYWCCKGVCDRALNSRFYTDGLVDGWEDIPSLMIPTLHIRWVVSTINQLHSGKKYAEEAIE